ALGRINVPMPRLEVEGIGVISFPVPSFQAEELKAKATAAPYGRGQETIYDLSIRACKQIAPDRLSLGGAKWAETLKEIVRRAGTDLGCTENSVSAELYKLLIYEPGGFFAPHRDTEKVDGMLATLVLALPGSSTGGELVVRHHGRETVIDMRSDDPSELNFAAFYADCEHEVRPIADGHRICLVYNLVLRHGGRAQLNAPDFSAQVEPMARELESAFDGSQIGAPDKVVWLLEHDYSEAGLSFDTLKNIDAAHGKVLAAAADSAGCAIHAAILHVSESASVEYDGWDREIEDVDEEDYEVIEIVDWESHLDNWMGREGEPAKFGKMELKKDELIPTGRLDYAKPDEVTLTEASGNVGASVDRLYRRAALVLWPAEQTSRALAASGANSLASFLNCQRERLRNGESIFAPIETLVESAAAHWPRPKYRYSYRENDWATATASALGLICEFARPETAGRFFIEVVQPNYSPELNNAILAAARLLDANSVQNAIRELVEKNFSSNADSVVGLALHLSDELDVAPDSGWREALEEIVVAVAGELAALGRKKEDDAETGPYSYYYRREPDPLLANTLAKYFTLIWRYQLEDRTEPATTFLLESPKIVEPERTVPELLNLLIRDRPEEAGRSSAMRSLWNLSAKPLIARSAVPPTLPSDWVTPASELDCTCSLCREIKIFCADPGKEILRVATAQSNRSHIRRECMEAGIDMEFHTERKGRPYILVCTKTRYRFDRRLKEYEQDLNYMQMLAKAADTLPCPSGTVADLRQAVSNAWL
ncbi:MAG: 2OG-Fe(II) oxygenase, partial [Albidovulum sp.]|nr:2OG-Fe(II) oxygenase [Albidovulum sp.]